MMMNRRDIIQQVISSISAASTDEAQERGFAEMTAEVSEWWRIPLAEREMLRQAFGMGWTMALQRVQDDLGRVIDAMIAEAKDR